MHTVRLETIHASNFSGHHQMLLPGEVGFQINKFEQVSSEHHQIGVWEVTRPDVQGRG